MADNVSTVSTTNRKTPDEYQKECRVRKKAKLEK